MTDKPGDKLTDEQKERLDALVVPGQPRRTGGVRKIVDIAAGEAAKLAFAFDDDARVVIGDTELRFTPGQYIVLPLETWTATLRRSLLVAQEEVEVESRQVRRAQRRALAQDRQN